MNTSHNQEILLLAQALAPFETDNSSSCPFCSGGISKDKSFSVTRVAEGVLYNCYRATCGESGFIPSTKMQASVGTVYDTDGKKNKALMKTFTPKIYKYSLVPLSIEQEVFFFNKFGLTHAEIKANDIKWSPARGSYAFPVFDYRGYTIGIMDRSYTGRKPKAIMYWEKDEPKMHFPQGGKHNKSTTIFLVEDHISAIKMSRYCRCVALLGTHLTDRAAVILNYLADNIVFCFDNDATNKAIKLAKHFSALFKGTEVLHLNKDPKDMTDKELKKLTSNKL